ALRNQQPSATGSAAESIRVHAHARPRRRNWHSERTHPVSNVSQSSLLEGERGHRRGVVLGLTLAEIMLLLLFCLLLAAAGLLQDREQQLKAVQEINALAQRRAELAEAALAESGINLPDLA